MCEQMYEPLNTVQLFHTIKMNMMGMEVNFKMILGTRALRYFGPLNTLLCCVGFQVALNTVIIKVSNDNRKLKVGS